MLELQTARPPCCWGVSVFRFIISVQVLIFINGEITLIDLKNNSTVQRLYDEPTGLGPSFPSGGLQGHVTHANPPTACDQLTNPAPKIPDGFPWILLITASGSKNCSLTDKVIFAQRGNYSAAIIYDTSGPDRRLAANYNFNDTIVIPSTRLNYNDSNLLISFYNSSIVRRRISYILRIHEESTDSLNVFDIAVFSIVGIFLVAMTLVFLRGMIILKRQLQSRHQPFGSAESKDFLKSISFRSFVKGDYDDTCAICLDRFKLKEKMRSLPCGHVYHDSCIRPWLVTHWVCPVCKQKIQPGRQEDVLSRSERSSHSNEMTPLMRERAWSNPESRYSVEDSITDTDLVEYVRGGAGRPSISGSDRAVLESSGSFSYA